MEGFYLDEYIKNGGKTCGVPEGGEEGEKEAKEAYGPFGEKETADFESLCARIYDEFRKEWENGEEKPERLLELQKKAITGCAPEVSFFKKKISAYLKDHNLFNLSLIHI